MDASALNTTRDNLKRLSLSLAAANRHFVVALSGGVDSTLLLLAAQQYCSQTGAALSAVHVHHGLSQHADDWLHHCQTLCATHNVTLTHQHVRLTPKPRQSLEALARDARYDVLLNFCRAHQGVLLLGHHLQDQLETILLQLKRGAGPKGLAGMGEVQQREGVTLMRPMLSLEKSAIEDAVKQQGVDWVIDDSNENDDFDRNFLRNQVIPSLTSRWPQFATTAARSASLCAEQDALLEEVTLARLSTMRGEQGQLSMSALRQQSEGWQRAIIRAWLVGEGVRIPSYAQLEQVRQIQYARPDAQPEVMTGTHCIRRFEDALYAVAPTQAPPGDVVEVALNVYTPLPWLQISVMVNAANHSRNKHNWYLRTGMPPARITPEGERMSKPLKQWLKLWKIPVWERAGVAVLYCDKEPAAIITGNADIIVNGFGEHIRINRKRG